MTTTQEFKNDLVHCIIHPKPDCVVELEVVASKELIAKSTNSALFAVTKQAIVPGFSKGKAPMSLVQSSYPKQVEEMTQHVLAQKTLQESIALTKLPILSNRQNSGAANLSYKVHNSSPDEAKIFYSFEVSPLVPVINPNLPTLQPVDRPVVEEKQVEETLRQALFFYAEWTPVKDRPIQEGDFVTLDVEITETSPSSSLFKDTRFEVTDSSMAKWMKDAVSGKNLNDVVEAISVPDDDVSEQEKILFPAQKVQITIKAIEQAKLPEITEEFAQKMQALSAKDLKDKIEKQLNDQADAHVQEKNKEQIIDFLLKNYSFSIPKSILETEIASRFDLLKKDSNFSQYWEPLDEEKKKKVLSFISESSEKSIRLLFLATTFCQAYKIPLPPQGDKKFDAPGIVDGIINYLTALALRKEQNQAS